MLTTTAYTGGVWLALFFGFESGGGLTLVIWGAVFLLLCMVLNLVHVNVFKLVITLGVYAEIIGSFGVALLLFFFFRHVTAHIRRVFRDGRRSAVHSL